MCKKKFMMVLFKIEGCYFFDFRGVGYYGWVVGWYVLDVGLRIKM